MDTVTLFYLIAGLIVGLPLGWGFHAIFQKRYLESKVKQHPEYQMYLDIINGEQEDKTARKTTDSEQTPDRKNNK